jgi:peptide deformylase
MGRLLQIAQLGNDIWLQQAKEVSEPTDSNIQALIDDMLVTLTDANGVGLAAPQVFESKRIIVVASQPNPRYPYATQMEPAVMINPVITWASDEMVKDWEGCLSVPGVRGLVPRNKSVKLTYLTRNGEAMSEEYSDFIARIIQHECDHLDSISFLDRMESTKEIVTEKEFLRIIAQ